MHGQGLQGGGKEGRGSRPGGGPDTGSASGLGPGLADTGQQPEHGNCVWEAGECWPRAAVTLERKRNVRNVGQFPKINDSPK